MKGEKRRMEQVFLKEACIPEIVEEKLRETYAKIHEEHKGASTYATCGETGNVLNLKMRSLRRGSKWRYAGVWKAASILLLCILFLGASAVAMLGGYEVEKGGMIRIHHADATMAGIFVTSGPIRLEDEKGIYCFEVWNVSSNDADYDYSDYVRNKFSYPEKTGVKQYAYIKIDDVDFMEDLSMGELFTIKCMDEEERGDGTDQDGNPVKVRLLKLSCWENLSKSGISDADFGVNSVHLNAEGYLKKFVADSDFLNGNFEMGIYEFQVLHSTHEGYSGETIPVLCPKDFAAFLEENKLGLNLRGVRCYDHMEYKGKRLWSIVSAATLDYDYISVETRLNLLEWYVKGLAERFTDGKASQD